MLRKIFLGNLLIFGFISTYAQTDTTKVTSPTVPEEPKPGPTITGSVDVSNIKFDNSIGGTNIIADVINHAIIKGNNIIFNITIRYYLSNPYLHLILEHHSSPILLVNNGAPHSGHFLS
jgi:hypothetical protein